MTAVSTLVTDAMYAAQVLGSDQTPSSGDAQLVLRRLNRMLDSWSNEKQMIFLNDSETFPLVAGQQAYTTAVLAGGRPVAINSMRVTFGMVDFPVEQIDQLKWNDIAVKSITSIPKCFYYDGAMPEASMFFFPIPLGGMTATIYCQRKLTGTLVMATDLVLPSGYEAAIVAALAVDISPSFGRKVTKEMEDDKRQTRAVLKRTNYTPMEMELPGAVLSSRDVSNGFLYKGF